MIRSKRLLHGLLIILPLTLSGCSYLGFETPTSVGPSADSTGQSGRDRQEYQRQSTQASGEEQGAQSRPVAVRDKNLSRSHCPDQQVAKLIVNHDFNTARFLLEEDLDRLSSVPARRCVLLSFALLYALPESSYNNTEKAREYQLKAQKVKGLERATMDVQLLNKSISSLLFLQERTSNLESDAEQLRIELEKKAALIERLKKLTLGGD